MVRLRLWTRCRRARALCRRALLLGALWGAWHLLALVQVGRPFGWITAWVLGTLAARVLLVWHYDRGGGSVFPAGQCHASQDLGWQLFPNRGSHWDPAFSALALLVIAVPIVLVWRPALRIMPTNLWS